MTQETAVQYIKNQPESSIENEKIEELKSEHRQFYWDFERPSVDKGKSLVWLCSSRMKGETDTLISAAQDQVLNTHYHQRNIMKQPGDSNCRIGCKAEE